MRPRDIKAELIKAGVSQIALATEIGVKPQFLNQVINGRRKTWYVREAIAKAIGLPYEDVWPEEES